jgi:hypothetical protein
MKAVREKIRHSLAESYSRRVRYQNYYADYLDEVMKLFFLAHRNSTGGKGVVLSTIK